MNTTPKITHEELLTLLDYDPSTGHLIWKTGKHSKRIKKGTRAGFLRKSGYRGITLKGKSYLEHHVIWFHQIGSWPKEIDHADHVKDNNAWLNLAEVTHSVNSRNMKQLQNTVTGVQGIQYNRESDTYVAHITVKGRKVFQKTYASKDVELAIQERQAKLIELGFHINHGK